MNAASQLKNHLIGLYRTLLEAHVQAKTLKPSAQEEICVKAFCVLAHAAFEEFLEKLCQETFHNAYMKYKSKVILTKLPSSEQQLDKINLGILQLIETLVLAAGFSIYLSEKSDALKEYKSKLERVAEIYDSGKTATIQDITELTKKTGSYTKEVLKDAKRFLDSHIDTNHGASIKYLLRLLIPVGIDIPTSLELNSLQKLADYRGDYAHSMALTQIISAADMTAYTKDCLKLCQEIQKSVDDFVTI